LATSLLLDYIDIKYSNLWCLEYLQFNKEKREK